MPAILPARLKHQTRSIVQVLEEPPRFVKRLHELLEYYADRTRRPGQTGAPPPILHTYQVPGPVMRQIWRDLAPLLAENPPMSLALADALWHEENLECRQLAIQVLGQIPATNPEPVLSRVADWAESDIETRLLDDLLTLGAGRLRRDAPEVFLRQIKNWLTSSDDQLPHLGLLALIPLIEQPAFDNLPVIFRLIRPVTLRAPADLRPYQLRLFKALAEKSPQETAFFLGQSLHGDQDSSIATLVRGTLPFFSAELQRTIKEALRAR